MNAPVADRIRARIAQQGSIGIDDYMRLALGDGSGDGYYATRDPFGASGDFITAPEVSQLFGEIVGAWCAHMWAEMGRPSSVLLVEPGPGRGTLMADILRVARLVPGFLEAATVHLVETSPALRQRQRDTLAPLAAGIFWHESLSTLPDGPMLLVANEFFDALPLRQVQHRGGGWFERRISLSPQGALQWTLAPDPVAESDIPPALRGSPDGAILETAPEREAAAREVGARLARFGGCALIIDYGFSGPATGDTFQALKAHAYADPLADPGQADLTSHVDCTALAAAATAAGASAWGPISQAAFLSELGIAMRARKLMTARPDKAGEIELALARLVSPDQMGALFKVACLTAPNLGAPPPFPPRSGGESVPGGNAD